MAPAAMSDGPGVVVVTGGAGGGIGAGICAVLAEGGHHVVVADIDGAAAEAVAAELRGRGLRADPLELDVADETAVEAGVDGAVARFGPPFGLVNSAGVGLVKPLAEITPAEWDRLHGVDVRGAFLMCRAVLPHMVSRGGGAIVNVGSVQALAPYPGYSAYSAAKAALIGLTRGIAADYGPRGIRCNIVHPGMVDSPQTRALVAGWSDPQEWIDDFVGRRQMIPVAVRPRHIGGAVAYLLSAASASVTAAELVVDGGTSMMGPDRADGGPHAN